MEGASLAVNATTDFENFALFCRGYIFFFLMQFLSFISFYLADNVQSLTSLLAPLVLDKKSCLCIVQLDSTGLFFTVEQGRSLQACAKLERGMFQEFQVISEEQDHFVVNLATMVDCLKIFGGKPERGSFE